MSRVAEPGRADHSRLSNHKSQTPDQLMGWLVRLLLVLGILCLLMNFVGAVASYYGTLQNLSQDPNASVDALARRASQLRQDPGPTFGWTVLGVTLIVAAIGLAVSRRGRRKRVK